MASWGDVRRVALALPGTSERTGSTGQQWRVRDRLFVWERPLLRPDLSALDLDQQEGPVLAARVADEGEKQALIAERPELFFTTPHFDGYPAVLARLDRLDRTALEELVVDAWRDRASARQVREWQAGRQ